MQRVWPRPKHAFSKGLPLLAKQLGNLMAFRVIINLKEFVSMRLGLPNIAVKIVQIGHYSSLRRFVGSDDGRARAGGVSSLVRATGGAA